MNKAGFLDVLHTLVGIVVVGGEKLMRLREFDKVEVGPDSRGPDIVTPRHNSRMIGLQYR